MQKMQDPSLYSQINTQPQPQFPEQEHLKCPRCDSPNTKFCYYNNYNLSQPRHFCKSCKRYWTKGGALRNIPIGGASRKSTKRTSNKKTPTGSVVVVGGNKSDDDHGTTKVDGTGEGEGQGQRVETLPLMGENFGGQFGDLSGSFTSLLDSGEGQFGNLLDGLGQNLDPGLGQDVGGQVGLESGSSSNGDGFLNIHQW